MTKSKASARVVVIGGGIIGCATAYYLTRAGISDVIVLEREGVASGASGYSAGLLTPYSGSNDPGLLALSAEALALHSQLAEELPDITGIDHGYDLKPYMRCAFAEPGYLEAQQFMQDRIADGLEAEWLSGDEARELCDWLRPEIIGACVSSIEPTLDSELLTRSVLKAAQTQGATLVDSEAMSISTSRGESNTQGVRLSDNSSIDADAIVIAMGPWSGLAGEWLGYEIPVVPQKGELLYMHLPADETDDIPQDKPPVAMHNVDDGGTIVPRRVSRTILGATKQDKDFDREPSQYARDFIIPRVQRLTDRISEASVTHHTACLRPMPADGKPYVGKAPGWNNIYIASGHWSEGVHYGPLTGKIISDLITTGETDIDFASISADRLVDGS